MKIESFQDISSLDWNTCCENSPQAWLYHKAEWVRLETNYFVKSNYSFAIFDKSRIVAIQPLYFSECGLGTWVEKLVHCGMHRHTGLAIVSGLPQGDLKAIRKLAMKRILDVANSTNADRIQLNVQNLAPESLSLNRQEIPFWMDGYGFFLGLSFGPSGIIPAPGMSSCCADQVIALSASEQELFANMDESCRRAVRKGIAAGLHFEAVTTDTSQFVDSYFGLAELSAKRTGETLSPRSYFADLMASFSQHGRTAIVFALYQDQKVAAVMLGIDKGAASYLGGVSHPDYLPKRVNDFVHWSAIQWAHCIGLKWYRLGPVFPEAPPNWPIAKISRFKGKFGSRSMTVIQGSRFLHPAKYAVTTAEHAAMICCKPIGSEHQPDDSR